MSEEHVILQGGWFRGAICLCQRHADTITIPMVELGNKHVSQENYYDTGGIHDGMRVFGFVNTTRGAAKDNTAIIKGGLWSRVIVPAPDGDDPVCTPAEYDDLHGCYAFSEYTITKETYAGMPVLNQASEVTFAPWDSVLFNSRLGAVNVRFGPS